MLQLRSCIAFAFAVVAPIPLLAQDWERDYTYAPTLSSPGNAFFWSSYVADGSLLIDGLNITANWNTYSGHRLVWLNPDGTSKNGWTPPTIPGYGVYGMYQQPGGKIVMVGGTSSVNQFGLRFNPDGTIDPTFHGNGPQVQAYCFDIDRNGLIYAMSYAARTKVVRYTVDGDPDPTFNSATTGVIGGIWAAPDGSVLVLQDRLSADSFHETQGVYIRLHHDGTLDPSFNVTVASLGNFAACTTMLPDGSLVAAIYTSLTDKLYHINTAGVVDLQQTFADNADFATQGEVAASFIYPLIGNTSIPFVLGLAGGTRQTPGSLWLNADGRMKMIGYESGNALAYWRTGVARPVAPAIASGTDQNPVSIGATETFSVTLSAGTSVKFQWSKNGVAIPGATDAAYTIRTVGGSDAGKYTCVVSNSIGSATWEDTLVVNTLVPVLAAAPAYTYAKAGGTATFTVTVTAGLPVSYQWKKNGTALPGATFATYAIGNVSAADMATYSCAVSNAAGTTTWSSILGVETPAHLVNLSTRVLAGGAAGTPTCGFVVDGPVTLPVLVRGVGPTLSAFGLTGLLPQPLIKLHNPDGTTTPFSGWLANQGNAMTTIGAFGLAAGSKDAATFLTLAGGKYTAGIGDANGASGLLLLETYDAAGDAGGVTKLINASTLGFVGTGDKAMFTGFVVKGTSTVRVLIRAVGPSLTAFSVPNPLSDPKIEIFQGSTKLGENDNWGTRTDAVSVATIQAVANSVGAFTIDPSSKDSVVIRDFVEGTYSAQITGVNGATGNAIVELYVVP